MTQSTLHTDDDTKPGNMTAEEYQAEHERRAQEIGPNGLHIVPQEYLDHIASQIAGSA